MNKQSNDLILDLRPVNQSSPRISFDEIVTSIKGRRVTAVAIFIIIILALWGLSTRNHSSEKLALSEAKSKIGSHMILPTDEEPTLVAVEDKKKVKDPFIASKSENGDVILIYPKNHVAIIYRPSVNKIVATGDLFADPALTEADSATISVLNGTNNESKTNSIITEIETLYPKANVLNGGKTNRQDFTTTIVIDNSQKKDYLVSALTQSIKGQKGVVPISETATASDIMIIVGKD